MEQLNFDLAPEPPAKPPEPETLPPPPSEERPALSLSSLLGPLGPRIDQLFEFMAVGEDEIERAKRRHPDQADAIHQAFRFLSPSEVIDTEPLYRAHAREILERVAKSQDLRPGTTAEVIGALSKLSLLAPPSRVQTLLYMKLFSEVFPSEARSILDEVGGMAPDSYEEARIEELEAEFRRKLRTERDCHAR